MSQAVPQGSGREVQTGWRDHRLGSAASSEALQRAKLLRYFGTLPLAELQKIADMLENPDMHSQWIYRSRVDNLSIRESQVLVLVANGYSRAEISHTLDISPNTAARHIANIYRKLDISTVAEATTYAIAAGLVAIEDPKTKKTLGWMP